MPEYFSEFIELLRKNKKLWRGQISVEKGSGNKEKVY